MNAKEFKVSKLSIQALKAVPTEAVEWSEKENASPSAEKAPYTLVPIRGANWTIDDLAKATAEETGCSIEEARYTWSAAMLLIGEILASGQYTSVDLGFWKFVLKVAGSLPNANAECDPAVNYPYIACYACRDLQAVAAGLETVQDVSGLPFVVNEVMELTDAKKADLGKVVNGRKAAINGLRLTMGHPGEKIELMKDGATYALTYDADLSKLNTQLVADVPAAIPGGKGYTLRVTAYGQAAIAGDAPVEGAEVVPFEKPNIEVKFVPPPPPEVAGVQCGENEPGVVWFEDGKLTITGEHLEGVSQVMFEADFNGTTEVCDITENIATKTATQIATGDNGFENTSEKTDLQWTGKSAKLVLVRDGARFEHAVQFKS